MSWIFGFYSKHSIDATALSKLHPKAIAVQSDSNYYIAIGGNNNMLFYDSDNSVSNFFVCGLPISHDAKTFIKKEDFRKLIDENPTQINSLNGHFAGAYVKNGSIKLFTDPLGLREFHIYENNDGWYFSTNLALILNLGSFEIDFNEFSTRWLLINQISNKSIVKNIHRINSGSEAYFNLNKCNISSNDWKPQKGNNIDLEDFKNQLANFTLLGSSNNSRISLSLSGGLDSRVILSFLLNSNYFNWDCHIFITEDLMDIKIAKQILSDFNIDYKIYSHNLISEDDIVAELFDYIGATYLTESGFTSRKLMNYSSLPQDEIIIDGGMGEIWRRAFLSRLYLFGKKDIEQKNYEGISRYLMNHRADIFVDDFNSTMNRGMLEQIENLTNDIPTIDEIGLGNWLDMFSLKTRLTNYYAPEQARIDNFVTSYMPFLQQTLLNNLLNLPVEKRINDRLFKYIIKSNFPKLSKYNLAKGNISYPFYFTPLMKKVYSILRKRINKSNDNDALDLFLQKMKSFIMDSLHSNSAKEYAPYNYKLIYSKVNSYYQGDKSLQHFVDWFLTFEIFRQILENKS